MGQVRVDLTKGPDSGTDVLADVSAVGDPPAAVVGAPEPVAPAQGGGSLGAGQRVPVGHGRAVS